MYVIAGALGLIMLIIYQPVLASLFGFTPPK